MDWTILQFLIPPIVASLILRPGCAFTSADLAAALKVAEQAIRDGGALLILAMNGKHRHDAKRRLIAAIEATF